MSQRTDSQLTTEKNVIKNENTANENSANRVGTMLENIIDSKINNDQIETASTLNTSGKTVAGRDAVKTYIDTSISNATPDATESTKGIVELATTSETTTGTDTTRAVTPAGVKAATDALTKSSVGLGNVDNTSDANKPVSTAQQTALDLKMNLGANSSFESLSDASDEYGIAFLSRLGAVFKATAVRWNETLKQFSIDGTQAIWSAIAGVTNGNMGIKALESVSEAFKIFDNTGNFFSVGVESAKRVVRIFTNFRLYNGVAYNEAEFKSEECAASTTTELKTITMPTDTIMTVDVTNIAVHNVDQDCIFGHAQFTFKNDSGTVTDLSQDKLRYEFQYSTIGTDGYVTSSVSRIDASISSADVSINFVNTVAKHTICQCEIKYNIVTLPVAP